MGLFLACILSCLWLLGLNERALVFQWHQHSVQVCKEARPPVDFATRASAWLLLNIRHKPFIYSASFFPRSWRYDPFPQTSAMIFPFASALARQGRAEVAPVALLSVSVPWVMSDLFLVPCACHAFKVCSLVSTGQTGYKASLLFDWLNVAFRSRHLVWIFIADVLKTF